MSIDLIAEELSEDAIALWRASGSAARNVASRLSITHLFCDPSIEERKSLGILMPKEIAAMQGFGQFWTSHQDAVIIAEERKMWPIRESFWLERLRTLSFNECVFILGTEHVDSFGSLLRREGFTVQVNCTNWKQA